MTSFKPKTPVDADGRTPPSGRNAEGDFKGQKRFNETHQSNTDHEAWPLIRALDLLIAVLGLIVVAPILLICAVTIQLTSDGYPIFAQQRVGRRQRLFTCYKLRTMRHGTVSAASHEVSQTAVTPLGAFLRRMKLDELPQLWNVVVGDMSLVGPRPCLPSQTALIAARDVRGVYRLRPGITGPAQVLGVDMSEPERLAQLDETWLIGRYHRAYLSLIMLTVLGRGRGDRVRAA